MLDGMEQRMAGRQRNDDKRAPFNHGAGCRMEQDFERELGYRIRFNLAAIL